MAREREWVTVTLHLSTEEHRKLKKMKDAEGLTWEEFVIKFAGIEDE
jgi:hypothetical protein